MAGVPHFPIKGATLSRNVGLDRVSLCVNQIGNASFPAGQYVFFTKANSTFYRYKTAAGSWSNDTLWIANVHQSSTKIDANGYPITSYVAANGAIKVQWYDGTHAVTTTVATSGSFPTVVVDQNDSYVVWVPPDYSTQFFYAQKCTKFSIAVPYSVTLPGAIKMMSITTTPDNRWFFAFEIAPPQAIKNKVYIGFTNPAGKFITVDLPLSADFSSPLSANDYFVIAEQSESLITALSKITANIIEGPIEINDTKNSYTLTPYTSVNQKLSEYFVVAEKGLTKTTQIVLQDFFAPPESFTVKEPQPPNTTLTQIFGSQPKVNEYFVINQDPNKVQETLIPQPKSSVNLNDFLILKEYLQNISTTQTDITTNANVNDLFWVSSYNPSYALTALTPVPSGGNPGANINTAIKEYTVLTETAIPSSNLKTAILNFPPSQASYFEIQDIPFPNHTLISIPPINNFKFSEGISIKESFFASVVPIPYKFVVQPLVDAFKIQDLSNSSTLSTNIVNKTKEFPFLVGESTLTTSITANLKIPTKLVDLLQIKDNFSTLFTTTQNISKYITEQSIQISASTATYSSTAALNSATSTQGNGFFVKETSISPILNINSSFNLPSQAGAYTFIYPVASLQEQRVLTFNSPSAIIPSYVYYYGKTNTTKNGPNIYNIIVKEETLSYSSNIIKPFGVNNDGAIAEFIDTLQSNVLTLNTQATLTFANGSLIENIGHGTSYYGQTSSWANQAILLRISNLVNGPSSSTIILKATQNASGFSGLYCTITSTNVSLYYSNDGSTKLNLRKAKLNNNYDSLWLYVYSNGQSIGVKIYQDNSGIMGTPIIPGLATHTTSVVNGSLVGLSYDINSTFGGNNSIIKMWNFGTNLALTNPPRY